MRRRCAVSITSLLGAMALLAVRPLAAQGAPAAAPAPEPVVPAVVPRGVPGGVPGGAAPAAAAQPLTVTVVAIEGTVSIREAPDQPWQPAQVGMTLAQGAEIATAPRSHARLAIPPDQVLLVDRLTRLRILRAELDAALNKVKTDLGMAYGRTRCDVEAGGVEHEARVLSPSATLTIRGTDAQLCDDGLFPASIASIHGRVESTMQGYRAVAIGGRRRSEVTQQRPLPASKARGDTVLDPRTAFAARTDADSTAVVLLPGLGGTDTRSVLGQRQGPRGGTELGSIGVTSQLYFILEWQGTTAITDLDLEVRSPDPRDPVLTRLTTPVPSRGQHNGQGVAGGDAPGRGREVAFWLQAPPHLVIPAGSYVATGRLVSEDTASNVTLKIQVDGTIKRTCSQPTLSADNPTITCQADIRGR